MSNIKTATCFKCGRALHWVGNLCEYCASNKARVEGPALTRDRVLEVLSRHIGKDNGVTIGQLANECTRGVGIASHRYIRKLVEELRGEGNHICAHPSRGYYIAESPEELEETISFLHSRAMTSLRQISAMKRVSLPDLLGQLQLRT